MNCSKCGNVIMEKAAFCKYCGTPVERPSYGQDMQQPNYGQPVMQPNYNQGMQQLDYGQTKPKKSKNHLVIGIVSVASVLIIGIVLLLIFKPWNTPKKMVKDFFEAVAENNTKQMLDTIYPVILESEYEYGASEYDMYYEIAEEIFWDIDIYDARLKNYTITSISKLDKSQVASYNSFLRKAKGYKKIKAAYSVCGTFSFYDMEDGYTQHANYEFIVVKCGGHCYLIDWDYDM